MRWFLFCQLSILQKKNEKKCKFFKELEYGYALIIADDIAMFCSEKLLTVFHVKGLR